MNSITPEKSLLDRIPVPLRCGLLLAYFLLFSLAATGSTSLQTTGQRNQADTPDPVRQMDPTGQAEAAQLVSAHQIPWLRLIVPDLMVSEWFESDSRRLGLWDRLPVISTALLLLAAVLLTGRSLLRCLRVVPENKLDSWVFSFAVGMSATSLYVLLIGLAGCLQVKLLYIVPVLAALVSELYRCKKTGWLSRPIGPQLQALIPHRQLWLLILPFGLIFAGAMLPPWEFDVREYHMQVPREWFENGQIQYLPHNVYGNMPLASELIMIPPMALGSGDDAWWHGALAGKSVMAFYALFTALGVMSIARRLGQNRSGWAAAVLVISCPWIGYIATTGLNEVALGCFVTSGILAIICSEKNNAAVRWILLAGILAGSAAATKYTGVVFAAVPLFIWAVWTQRTQWQRAGLVFIVGGAIIFAPWLAKNVVFTGNPTYPLLHSVFQTSDRSPELIGRWNRAHQVPENDRLGYHVRNIFYASSRQSPLLIALLLVSLLLMATDRRLRPFGLFLLFGMTTWWLATHHLERFLVPLLPVAAVLAGITLDRLLPNQKLFWSVCVLLSVYGFLYVGSGLENDSRILVKLDLLRNGPALSETTGEKVHRYLNKILTVNDRVLLAGDAEPFDLTMKTIYSTCFDPDALALMLQGKSATQQREALAQAGVDYIYVSWEEIQRYRSTYGYDDYVTRDLFAQELVPSGVLVQDTGLQIDPQYGQLFRCVR